MRGKDTGLKFSLFFSKVLIADVRRIPQNQVVLLLGTDRPIVEFKEILVQNMDIRIIEIIALYFPCLIWLNFNCINAVRFLKER